MRRLGSLLMHFLPNKLLPDRFSRAISKVQDKQMLVPGHVNITPNSTKPTSMSCCGQSTETSFSSLQHKACVCAFLLSANSSMQYETENIQSSHNLDHTNGALIKGLLERCHRAPGPRREQRPHWPQHQGPCSRSPTLLHGTLGPLACGPR